MADPIYNVLFICTGNSARSIMAEALLNNLGKSRFKAYSAGSQPTGVVNPLALQTLRDLGLPSDGFRSKSWGEFATPDSPPMDFIFTVCDRAAGEVCPVWPGQPLTAQWGVPDPAAQTGPAGAKAKQFLEAALTLKRRIEFMLCRPLGQLDPMSLQRQIDDIGRR